MKWNRKSSTKNAALSDFSAMRASCHRWFSFHLSQAFTVGSGLVIYEFDRHTLLSLTLDSHSSSDNLVRGHKKSHVGLVYTVVLKV